MQPYLPHKRGIHLHSERVVFKRRDLTEDFREQQVQKSDDDGRKILEKQTDEPVVPTLRNVVRGVIYEKAVLQIQDIQ